MLLYYCLIFSNYSKRGLKKKSFHFLHQEIITSLILIVTSPSHFVTLASSCYNVKQTEANA